MADDLLVVTGRVETRSQPNANGFVNLKIGNVDRISTKLPDLLAGLDAGIWVKAAYTEAPGTGVDKAGRPFVNRRLVRWEPVETESLQDALTKPGQQAPPEPVKGNWETAEERAARNRSIAMQHSQTLAAEYCGESDLDRVRKTAWVLYADVLRAWAGDDFSGDPAEPEAPAPSALDAHFGPKPVDITDLLNAMNEAGTMDELGALAKTMPTNITPDQIKQGREVYARRRRELQP